MIRTVLFDLGGVLVDLNVQKSVDAFTALLDQSRLHGDSPVSALDLIGGGENELMQRYQVGEISTRTFLDTILSVCLPCTTEAQIREAWFAMLIGIREDRKRLLRDLKQAGYQVYILSNINEMHVEWTMAHCEELNALDGLFFSNEIGLAKPDKRCYDLVVRETGIVPEQTLYIDDLLPNVEAGKKAGFQTIQAQGDAWIEEVRNLLNL